MKFQTSTCIVQYNRQNVVDNVHQISYFFLAFNFKRVVKITIKSKDMI